MAELKLQLLGDIKVMRDGAALPLPPSKKTRALLAYLALSPRAYRREQLCELLWEIPDDPRGSLRWSLSKLRRLVDDDNHTRIVADRNQVAFATEDAQIDVSALISFSKNDLSVLPLTELEKAVETYHGLFLEGLELPDFHDFYSWCIGQREQVCRCQIQLHQALVQRLENEPERALAHAEKLTALAPYEESAHITLASLLLALGRNKEAEQQVKRGRHLLQEAGVPGGDALNETLRRAPLRSASVAAKQSVKPLPASSGRAVEYARGRVYGRDAEIQQLVQAFNRSCEESRAELILVRGEPGIGKSRLLQTGREMTEHVDTCLLEADAFESEIVRPFALWSDALRRSQSLEIPDLFSGEKPVQRDQLFAGLSDLISRETAQRPVVIIFDDLQWCDESSAAALHYILRMNRGQPLYVLAAGREAELRQNVPMQQAIRGLRHEKILRELVLGPLSDQALRELIEAKAPGANTNRLSQESAGNPLLAIELARAESTGSGSGSLSELVRERLSRLDADAIEVLSWASVLAPNIAVNTLERVAELGRARLDVALDAAVQQGMLVSAERGFRFSHDMICSSVYLEISEPRRQVMHRRIAEQLEVDTALDLQLAADLAHHAAKSGDAALAARSMVSAGRLCLRFYANEDALNLAMTGLEQAKRLPEADRVCVTLELSDVRVAAAPVYDWETAANEYVELAELALDYGALPHARLGYHLASTLRWIHGDWVVAQRDTLQAERVTRGASDEEHILGMAETAKCLALLERDLPQADAMLMEAGARATRNRVNTAAIPTASGILRYYEGKLDEAAELLQEAWTISKAQGNRIDEYLANEYLFMIDLERNDHAGALRRCQTLLTLAEKLREGSELPFSQALNAMLQYAAAGESPQLETALQDLREVDAKHRLSYVLNRLAFLNIEQGAFAEALSHANEALVCTRELGRASEMMLARTALATAYQALGQTPQLQEQIVALKEMKTLGVARWARVRADTFTNTLSEMQK